MAFVIYVFIILSTVTQSASTKIFNRHSSQSAVFNSLKSLSAFALFLLMSIPNFTLHYPTVIFGILYGLLMCISMYAGYKALCLGPMALTSMLVSFSVIIPLVYSLTFGNETLKAIQCVAFVFLLAAIILSNYDKLKANSEKPKIYGLWLLFIALTFVGNGICSILQKEHQLAYPGLYSREFIMFAMLICSLIFTITAIIKIPLKDIKTVRGKRFGIISGVTNALANFLTLILAGMENASVLFPIISAGTILGALLCGKFVFKEKLKANHYLALAAGIIAVVFLKL